LNQEAHKYAALEVKYIGGKDPEILFLDDTNKVVASENVADYDEAGIRDVLGRHGITLDTPKPEYKPPTFDATEHCIAWRRTGECSPTGPMEPMEDEHCNQLIPNGVSGFCECKGTSERWEATCEHAPFTCEDRCHALKEEAEEETTEGDEL